MSRSCRLWPRRGENTWSRCGPWATWKHRPGGVYLLRGDGIPEPERVLLLSAARAVLSGEHGTLTYDINGASVTKSIVPQTFGSQWPSCS